MARDRNDILKKQNELLEEIRESVKTTSENAPLD